MSIDATVLTDWFDANARDLPWRAPDTTAWGVLVSEIMLQQTPVARVTPAWHDWLARWPRPSDLAAATPADVLRAWGQPGAYTARAVAAFAYRRRAPVVDTNVRRVIARAVHGAGDAGPASTTRDLADADALLPADDATAAKLSAALMELGAVVCTARAPRCADCPVRAECAWQLAGRPAYTGPAKPVQRFAGTDRQVRGLLLDVLRETTEPVRKSRLDIVWSHSGQRDRCLDSLLVDGLVEQTSGGLFALPGEHEVR